MTKFKLTRVLVVCAGLLCIETAQAALSPVSLGILPPVQLPPSDFTITGARISALWGRQRDVYGLDLGVLGNITDGDFVGAAVSGVFNVTRGSTTIIGAQVGGLTNYNSGKAKVIGLQLSAGVNVNTAESTVAGLAIGLLANVAPHTNIYGAQVGLYNKAQEVYGLQIGLINFASSLHGIQIGLLNFNHTGLFAVSPIINIGF